MKTKHTATPWLLNQSIRVLHISPANEERASICEMFDSSFITPTEAEANARFICQAVNSHDELVEALERLLRFSSTIEYLGEWEAMDVNTGRRKTIRAKVDEVINAAQIILKKAKGEA